MLFSADLPNSQQIFIHGFISVDGQKISKSLGNAVDPYILISKYGTDALRYYLLREIPSYADGDFSEHRFKELYNADLANGLGNLVARVAKLSNTLQVTSDELRYKDILSNEQQKALEEFRFNDAIAGIWDIVKTTNKFIDENAPWKLSGKHLETVLLKTIGNIQMIATLLQPFLPDTAEKILTQFKGPAIVSQPPLFPRLN